MDSKSTAQTPSPNSPHTRPSKPSLVRRLARKINRSLTLPRSLDDSAVRYFPTSSSWTVPYAVCVTPSSSSDVKLELPCDSVGRKSKKDPSSDTPTQISSFRQPSLRKTKSSWMISPTSSRCPSYSSSLPSKVDRDLAGGSATAVSPPSYEIIEKEIRDEEELEVRRREILERDRIISDGLRVMGL